MDLDDEVRFDSDDEDVLPPEATQSLEGSPPDEIRLDTTSTGQFKAVIPDVAQTKMYIWGTTVCSSLVGQLTLSG